MQEQIDHPDSYLLGQKNPTRCLPHDEEPAAGQKGKVCKSSFSKEFLSLESQVGRHSSLLRHNPKNFSKEKRSEWLHTFISNYKIIVDVFK